MSDPNSQESPGLSESELQGQEAHTLPDREVMSLLSGATMPGASTLLPLDGPGLDPQVYPDTGQMGDALPASGSQGGDLPAYNTADTNSVQTSTSATDSATS